MLQDKAKLENHENSGLNMEQHGSTTPRIEREMQDLLVPRVAAIVDGEDSLLNNLHNENSNYQRNIFGPLRLGAHVSLSKDGSTIAVGSPLTCTSCSAYDMNGIVQIYRRKNTSAVHANSDGNESNNFKDEHEDEHMIGSSWENIGKLIQGHESNHHLGMSISLSSDGNIVAVGTYAGYAKVYQYNQLNTTEGGNWIQVGQVLSLFSQDDAGATLDTDTNASTNGNTNNSTILTFGRSVSLSNTGDSIAIRSMSQVFIYQ